MEKCDFCSRDFEYNMGNDWDWDGYHFCSKECAEEAYEVMWETYYGRPY